ncbi:2-dehydropantoate 2-reductase (Ketopantoate reductase) (KPA reductase) (KPR) [Aspergillus niger]|uniref:2-dehydropantoate 2-reductase n=1 Tax=Aspergillus niger TaxID=5061 RepID=A0A9W6EDI6_ASPNG|nr:2-dehydropantoate 2-reductase (Ketopantoate reductase) (KPA reductase) (KPR) [Aspergillus niger]
MTSQRIHLIGLGSIGTLIAHSLRSLPTPPPITILLHRESAYQDFLSGGSKLRLQIGEDGPTQETTGYDAELLQGESPIHHLIVAVKASATIPALRSIQHRLGRHSVICLFQNGLGQIEELNERLFTDPLTRPTYMFGIMRHGVYIKAPFEAVLAGLTGSCALGIVNNDQQASSLSASSTASVQSRFLINRLVEAPIVRCSELPWMELHQAQLLKLATNCVVNPLTALLDVRNGSLLANPELQEMQRQLLQEISLVFRRLPELQGLPDVEEQFSVARLEEQLIGNIEKTASNSSSMREDVRAGRATEIAFINGWIVRRGQQLGLDCPTNRCLTQLILAKSSQGR